MRRWQNLSRARARGDSIPLFQHHNCPAMDGEMGYLMVKICARGVPNLAEERGHCLEHQALRESSISTTE